MMLDLDEHLCDAFMTPDLDECLCDIFMMPLVLLSNLPPIQHFDKYYKKYYRKNCFIYF